MSKHVRTSDRNNAVHTGGGEYIHKHPAPTKLRVEALEILQSAQKDGDPPQNIKANLELQAPGGEGGAGGDRGGESRAGTRPAGQARQGRAAQPGPSPPGKQNKAAGKYQENILAKTPGTVKMAKMFSL